MISLISQASLSLPLMLLVFGALFTSYDRWRRLKSGYYDKRETMDELVTAFGRARSEQERDAVVDRVLKTKGSSNFAHEEHSFPSGLVVYPLTQNAGSLLAKAVELDRESRGQLDKAVEERAVVHASVKVEKF